VGSPIREATGSLVTDRRWIREKGLTVFIAVPDDPHADGHWKREQVSAAFQKVRG
jgi:hypothetical protein